MKEVNENFFDKGLANLAIDPEILAKELEAELLGDPLDEIEIDQFDVDQDKVNAAKECEQGLKWLKSSHEERLQGLRVFCEYRDARALPLLVPLLDEACPVERMSAVYALGRNPCPRAVDILLNLLQFDSNAYVRKAAAWSLGNYSDERVLQPLLKALKTDVAAVRLWASSSLAEIGLSSSQNSEIAAKTLLVSLRIDSEPIVRSNCIWSLGRLYSNLQIDLKQELLEDFIAVLLNDVEPSVRYEARVALDQLEDPDVKKRIQMLIDDGLLA